MVTNITIRLLEEQDIPVIESALEKMGWRSRLLMLENYLFEQNEGCGNIPPAQAMSKVVPFKDWNDIVRDRKLPDIDYKVSLHCRQSVRNGNPVVDATLIPLVKQERR